jgi:membrane protein DedA with SNARE-associated domain
MLHHLIQIWFGWVTAWGYPGIILLMAMESSIFPVPSEVVIPPAAYLAAQGKLSLWGVVAAGTFGSWLGAALTYWASRSLGRVFIARWGRWFLVTPEKLDRAEIFLARYSTAGVFFSRLLPVIRHLIGIPCGLIRMDFLRFSVMTVLGSALWCSVLAWYGAKVGRDHPQAIDNPELFIAAVKSDMHLILLAIVALAGLYLLALWLTRPRRPAPVQG